MGFFNDHTVIVFIAVFSSILVIREILTFRGHVLGKYVFTPLVTASVLLVCFYAYGLKPRDPYIAFILWGLIFSLIADVLLMIVQVRLLLEGLIFFLIAHLMYILAFTRNYTVNGYTLLAVMVIVAGIAVIFAVIRKKTGSMTVPVLVYTAVISLMVFFAISGNYHATAINRGLAVSGAVMFLVSDCIIACDAFLRPVPHSTVFVWALYAPGQMAIALSCL